MMLMNGVGKSRAEIAHALAAGIGQLNAESLAELEMIAEVAEELSLLRVVLAKLDGLPARTGRPRGAGGPPPPP